MSKLKCERRNGYLVCYPRRRRKKPKITVVKVLAALGIAAFFLLLFYPYIGNPEAPRPVLPPIQMITPQTLTDFARPTNSANGIVATSVTQTLGIDDNVSKLQAVEYLNYIRSEEGIPPVQLINLNVAKYRAEYLAQTNLFSHYDAGGRHPGYWYTQLDGGLYGVEENLMARYVMGGGQLPSEVAKVNYTDAIYSLVFNDALSMWGHRDSLLDPCNNYAAMATSYFWNGTYGARYYVVYMVAKWVEWISPPHYEGGRFTAEGYAAPEMKPKFFAVYYAKYESNPASRHSYDVGDLYLCKVLDNPLATCKDAQEPAGTFIVERAQDGRWYIKIDASASLDKPGLYTFEIIAEDLRGIKWSPMSPRGDARIGRCVIMEYTVEI